MIKFTTRLFEDMIRQIQKVSLSQADEYEKAMQCFHITETSLMKLKEFILGYTFRDDREEIEFFKKVKPKFHSQLLYYVEIIHIENNKPLGTGELLKSFYNQVSERLNLHFSKQNLIYLYYRTNRSSEDELLFLRGNDCIPLVPEDSVDMDSNFSTIASSCFSRLMAFENVLKYVGDKLEELDRKKLEPTTEISKGKTVWTLTKTDLIELGYGLYAAKAVNYGHADIKQIMTALGSTFGVDLSNSYKIIQNIRIRQGSRTGFLDELTRSLQKYMDETDMNYSG